MKKNEKTAILIAVILVVAGLVISSLAFRTLGSTEIGIDLIGNKTNTVGVGSAQMVTNTHSIDEKFANMDIRTETAYVNFELSKDGECKVVCEEHEQDEHEVYVENGTLIIKKRSGNRTFITVGISTGRQSITVYLPQKSYDKLVIATNTGDVSVPEFLSFGSADVKTDTGYTHFYGDVKGALSFESDTGDITAQDINPKTLNVSTDTGKVSLNGMRVSGDVVVHSDTGDTEMTGVKCRGLEMSSNTGDIILGKVIASANADIETDTGDVYLKGFDAEEIYIRTNTGEVMGTILSEKVFLTESDTGRIDVPKSITGGRCEITTDTGDITIEVA